MLLEEWYSADVVFKSPCTVCPSDVGAARAGPWSEAAMVEARAGLGWAGLGSVVSDLPELGPGLRLPCWRPELGWALLPRKGCSAEQQQLLGPAR